MLLKPHGYYLEHFWQADLGYIGQAIIGVKVPNSSYEACIQHGRVNHLILPLAKFAKFHHFWRFEKILNIERLLQPHPWTLMSRGIARKIFSISYIWFSLVLSVVTSLVKNCIKIIGHLRADQNYGYMSSLARTLRLNIILFWLGWQMHILFVVNWGKKTHHSIQSPEVLLRTGKKVLLRIGCRIAILH